MKRFVWYIIYIISLTVLYNVALLISDTILSGWIAGSCSVMIFELIEDALERRGYLEKM